MDKPSQAKVFRRDGSSPVRHEGSSLVITSSRAALFFPLVSITWR